MYKNNLDAPGQIYVQSIIETAPYPIGVYIGEELIIQVANQSMLDAWGKGPDVIGRKYQEVLPELEDQNIINQLLHVYRTGESFQARNK